MTTLIVARRELLSLFASPTAWVLLAVVQVVVAYLFLTRLQVFLEWQPRLGQMPSGPGLTAMVVSPLFKGAAMVMMLLSPLVTMRALSEERRNATLTLLFSSPVTMTQIVLGKSLGAMGFFTAAVLMVLTMPLALLLGGSLDWGMFIAAALGLTLAIVSFVSVGIFMSTLTSQPPVAAASTFGLLMFLWMLEQSGAGQSGTGAVTGAFSYLSITAHLDRFLRGIFDLGDVTYFLLVGACFTAFSIRRLDHLRLAR